MLVFVDFFFFGFASNIKQTRALAHPHAHGDFVKLIFNRLSAQPGPYSNIRPARRPKRWKCEGKRRSDMDKSELHFFSIPSSPLFSPLVYQFYKVSFCSFRDSAERNANGIKTCLLFQCLSAGVGGGNAEFRLVVNTQIDEYETAEWIESHVAVF